jgi:2',5'-phosphodiesterase
VRSHTRLHIIRRCGISEEVTSTSIRQVNGAEPDFTNYARIFDDPPFIDSIDFIFVSRQVEVTGCKPLKHRDEVRSASLPDAEEPSDHVLVAADLRVP